MSQCERLSSSLASRKACELAHAVPSSRAATIPSAFRNFIRVTLSWLRSPRSRRDPEPPRLRGAEAHEADVDGFVADPPQDEAVEDDVSGAGVDDLVALHEHGDGSILRAECSDEF